MPRALCGRKVPSSPRHVDGSESSSVLRLARTSIPCIFRDWIFRILDRIPHFCARESVGRACGSIARVGALVRRPGRSIRLLWS